MAAACLQVPQVRPRVRCPTGEARITPGFSLAATHVIHAVGPRFASLEHSAPKLTSAWVSSLDLAVEHGIRSIAFPAISCGVYGYPHGDAAEVALLAVRDHSGDIPAIRVVLFGQPMFDTWVETGNRIFRRKGEDLVLLVAAEQARGALIVAALRGHGLHPTLVHQGLAALVGAAQHIMPARVLVPASEHAEATATLAVIDAMEVRGSREGEPKQCPACGVAWEPSFDECWNCQTPLQG